MSLQEVFLASPLVLPGSDGARRMTATSGLTCTAVSTKSGPIGLFVKTLAASSRWSSRAVFLRWQVRRLSSERKTPFTDTNSAAPSPSNASAVTSKPTDIPSSRYLYQLAPLGLPTDETECSSSDTATPAMMPTPLSQGLKVCDNQGKTRFIDLSLLPTPTAAKDMKWTNTWDQNSQMGQSLSAMAASGMLPTPRTSGQEGYESRAKRKGHECAMSYLETAVDYVAHQTNSDPAGEDSRLSPLFTEEVMGFPFLWTTLPFLSQSGRTRVLKPTATPSSRK